jgi:putative transposase
VPLPRAQDGLTDVPRRGARQLLAQAFEAEVADRIGRHRDCRDAAGRRRAARHGHLPERTTPTGIGAATAQQPRVHGRRAAGQREEFGSATLPPYPRKTGRVEGLAPRRHPQGAPTGDFSEAPAARPGPAALGPPATAVTRLEGLREQEYHDGSRRSPAGKQCVDVWAAGVHFNTRLAGGRQCILVLAGATADGREALIAIRDGHRESAPSRKDLLRDAQARGSTIEPKRAIGDGAPGSREAVRQAWPRAAEPRCWGPKAANVLDELPQSAQPKAKEMLHEVSLAAGRAEAEKAPGLFPRAREAQSPRAAECLGKGRQELLAFHGFPAGHRPPLRTTAAIEGVFAAARLRAEKTKGSGARVACRTMAFKLRQSAARHGRALNGSGRPSGVIQGTAFADGMREEDAA